MKTYDDSYKIKTKMKNKFEYICIFHCPITLNDCINSMDLKDDKVIFGTLMGDAYLCRIDEEMQLYTKSKNKISDKIIIPPLNIANIMEKDNSDMLLNKKLNSIKLSVKDNYDNNNNITSKKNLEIMNIINEIKFPKITQIINRSRENIPCVEFESDDIINICIGDLEIIHLEKMSTFNKNDKNSTYNFSKLRNYKTENEHIICCETATCFLKNSFFLIIFTKFGEFEDKYQNSEIKYENKNLNTGEIIKGIMNLSNFVVPFDFDGDMFLYIDYISKEEKFIGIEYTKSKKESYKYKINEKKNFFGHISHMKLMLDEKIFLVRNEIQCEIRKINDDFEILEKFYYLGSDILSCCLYYKENNESLVDILVDVEYEKNNEDDLDKSNEEKIEKNVIKLFANKNNLVDSNKEKTTMINTNHTLNFKNKKKNKSRAEKNNKFNKNSLISDKNFEENNKVISSIENIKKIKVMNSSSNKISNNMEKSSTKKSIYKRINYYTVDNYKNNNSNDLLKCNIISSDKKNLSKKDNSFSSIEIFEKKNKNLNKNLQNKEKEDKTMMIRDKKIKGYKIIFLDHDGSVFLYHNNTQINLFNIYDINNIKQKYKNIQFFSLGFPYHIIANDYYICITTDFGLFVFSKVGE